MSSYQDLVEYAVYRVSLANGLNPDADRLIGDVRKLLRKVIGRRQAKELRTKPSAPAYFAGLVLPVCVELDAVRRALDDVRDRFGSAALTRAVLLGRDEGLSMPMLPD
jgi:hypothetical protein